MNLTVVGTGYVGLVTGACFAEMGNRVTCVDIDKKKIEDLKNGIIPIYEPGLEQMVLKNVEEGRIFFSTSLDSALIDAEVAFIAVGTPPGEDGSADLRHVLAVAREIGQHIENYLVVVDKSTVPVGTAKKVTTAIYQELAKRQVSVEFDVVSNPEFLKEGAAIDDFMRPDRIVIGSESNKASELMKRLYAPFNKNHERTLFMGVRDAEMTKYAANAMLATKISFINEVANICDELDVDVENVRKGIGSDSRIGFSFIYPGCGYGGSCFPKDVKALVHMAEALGVEPTVLNAVEERNRRQHNRLVDKIKSQFGDDLSDMTIGIWGLAFKPGTDDMREAPALSLIEGLIPTGAKMLAYDPVAHQTALEAFPDDWTHSGKLKLVDNQYDAANDVDILVLVTEWKQFRNPDLPLLREKMKRPVIFDGRNQYDPKLMDQEGFTYVGIGRKGTK